MTARSLRTLFIVVGALLLAMMVYLHAAIPGLELLLGIVVGVLLVVSGLRGRVL
jgi:hypothetical protein